MIEKLLLSELDDDNIIGLTLLRAKYPNNWGQFEGELYKILYLNSVSDSENVYKYFANVGYGNRRLKHKYSEKIP